MSTNSIRSTNSRAGRIPNVAAGVFIVLSVIWAFSIGSRDPERISLALVTITCSFGMGSLIGFVFTIFGEEIESLGKARDSVVAVVSGFAGLGVGKTAEIGGLLGRIQLFPRHDEASSWFSVLFVTTYVISGFYAMYFVRKLTLNPALAEAHQRLERTTNLVNRASEVLIEIEKKIPKNILSGREAIEDIDTLATRKDATLRDDLLGTEVSDFLTQCEEDVAKGSLSIDLVNKAAVLHYYRVRCFPQDSGLREKEAQKAIDWLTRATMIDPHDPEPQLKLAEVYGLLDDDDTCIAILEKLERNEESPQYLDQWLGFYLLFADGRDKDAIRHSEEFLKKYPNSEESILNIARAYAQLFKSETEAATNGGNLRAEYRASAIANLQKCIGLDPDLKDFAKEKSAPGESFEALKDDPEFLKIIAQDQPSNLQVNT